MPDPDPARPPYRGWLARLLAATSVGYTCVLLWATHHPRPEVLIGTNPPSDKLLHLGTYAVLSALVTATLAARGPLSPRTLRSTVGALAILAVVDEVTQPLPWFGRSADPVDWVCDVGGIAVGAAAVAAVAAALHRSPAASNARGQ